SLTVWLGARALRTPTAFRFLLCGLAAGCGYLTRPEGLELAAAIAAIMLLRQAVPAWHQNWRRLAPQAPAPTCRVLALLGPYVATIGRLSNKNTIKLMQGDPNANWQALPHAARGAEATPLAGAARTPLAVWWFEPSDHGKSHALWGLTALLRETVQSLHYGVAAFALLGLAWFRPRPRGRLGAWLLAAIITGHALIVWWMAAKIGYFSER